MSTDSKIKALIGEAARQAELTRVKIVLEYRDHSHGKEILKTNTNDSVEDYQNRIDMKVTAEPLKLRNEH